MNNNPGQDIPEQEKLRILYVGPLGRNGTCYARLRALRALGFEVEEFDTDPFIETLSHAARALSIGFGFSAINREFEARCRQLQPGIIWLDKAFWLNERSLRFLHTSRSLVVHHNTDALSPQHLRHKLSYWRLRRAIKACHVYITTNRGDFEGLQTAAATCPKLVFSQLGYCHYHFDDSQLGLPKDAKWQSEVLFCGHYEPRTEQYVSALIAAGVPVKVYGYGWRWARNKKALGNAVQYRGLSSEEYLQALKGAKICLGFVSKWNGNETSGRSYEIPALGKFLLAMRTRQHSEHYLEAHEAEFFSSPEELVSKARHYLEYAEKREAIAARGRARCLSSGYNWQSIMERDLLRVAELFPAFRNLNVSILDKRVSHSTR